MVENISDYTQWQHEKLLGTGFSGSGKSTFAMYAPQPIFVMQFEGNPVIPPGIDQKTAQIKYKKYPPVEALLENDVFDRPRNVGDEIIRDVRALQKGFREGKLVIDETEFPWLPKTVIFDGAATAADAIANRVLAIAKKRNPEDFENRYTAWMLRLRDLTLLYGMLIPLPCNIIILTWPNEEMDSKNNKTGILTPELGGKLDIMGPGKVDSSLYFYPQNGRFMVRTQSNNLFKGFKVRNGYNLPEILDITIDKSPNLRKVTPWEALWGKR